MRLKTTPKFPLALLIFCFTLPASGQTQELKIKEVPPAQNVEARFRLFQTDNMWTKLLLDTRNGRVWQVSFSVSKDSESVKLPINTVPLVAGAGERDGRFTLYPTENMWTFILLDQDTGDVWQCQYSMDNDNARWILPITAPRK
jgi:hypothetical protein